MEYRRIGTTRAILLQDKETAEQRRDEDDSAHSQRGKGELAGAESGSGTLAGSRAASRTSSSTGGDSTITSTGQVGLLRAGRLGTIALEARTGTSTVLEVVASTAGESGKLIVADSNVPGLALLGALRRRAAGLVTTVAGGVGRVCVGVLESGEVVKLLDVGAVNLNETVLGVLLRVFVDKTTGVDRGHVGAVDGLDLVELTLVGVAAKLGEEDGNAVILELLNLLVPTSTSEGVGVTPRVVVEGVEVRTDSVLTAVHVVSHLVAVGLDVSCTIADGDLAKLASVHVRLDVTGDSLNEGSAVGGGVIVDDLVTREEEKGVLVGSELLDGRENALKVDLVVGDLGRSTVDRVLGSVDVEREVDASISQSVHAFVVVGCVVNSVDTDGVDAKLLEFGDVALAACYIGDGVLRIRCTTGLVVDTTDVEALAALPESCECVSAMSSARSLLLRKRTIALDGDGCDISTLLDGSGRSASNSGGEGAGDDCDGVALHCGGGYVSDGISSLIEIGRKRLFVDKHEEAVKRQTVKGSGKRECEAAIRKGVRS